MAIGDVKWDPTASRKATRLQQALNQLDAAIFNLDGAFRGMVQTLDNGAVTTNLRSVYGCPDAPNAEALYNEINALQAKLLGNGTVDHVFDASKQAIAKLG